MKLQYIIIVIATLCMACDPLANPRHGSITFSSDTLYFDTVFTTIGSSTLELRARNASNGPLLIDRIWLAGGDESPFRININGNPSSSVENLTIAAGDSIFIFADVEVDPTGNDLPVSVYDSIMFSSGENMSHVILMAWGQDIWLFDNDTIENTIWSGKKPFVIYKSLFVDTLATLSISEGTRILFHNDASMIVAGKIIASGSKDFPVIFASDRTSEEFEDVPGQWKGIIFRSCSNGNKINDAVIRNADIAIDLQGETSLGIPDIDLLNTSVLHNTVNSLRAVNASVKAANSLFAHTGFSTVYIISGGAAEFTHCTIANRWGYFYRSASSFFIGKGPADGAELPQVSVYNSTITGDRSDELKVEALPNELSSKVLFDSCLIEIDTLSTSWWNRSCFNGVIFKKDPLFISWYLYDFRPDTLSPLSNTAGKNKASLYPEDIRHKPRPAFGKPDIGAYERQSGEMKH
jgi:hypothetical protein